MVERTDFSSFVHHETPDLASMTIAVEGIHCAACIGRIEGGMKALPGVQYARLNVTTNRLNLSWNEGKIEPTQIFEKLQQLGFEGHPFQQRLVELDDQKQSNFLLRCVGVAGFAAMNIMLLSISVWAGHDGDISPETRDFFHWLSALVALPAAAYAGRPFFISAVSALKTRSLNMDVPISLGVILALAMSVVETIDHAEHAYFDSAVMLLFFLLCGRYLDQLMRRRTRAVVATLAAMKGEMAHRIEANGELVAIPASALHTGDRLLLRAGDRVPADVIVLSGSTSVDEALVTGETLPRPAGKADMIYAGSVNLSGAVTVKVVTAGNGTLIDEVERLLEKAVSGKSVYTRLADRAAQLYAPLVHLTAACTLLGWLLAGHTTHDAIIAAIAVLIITCPCALALAVPVVQVVAAGTLFKSGILFNSSDALERMAHVNTVVFDKTGTLTLPEARVVNAATIDPPLLEMAARLALSSHHPMARSLACEALDRRPFENAVEEPGYGVRALIDGDEARLGSLSFCGQADNTKIVFNQVAISQIAFSWRDYHLRIEIEQALRPDAIESISVLRKMGLELHILSGDRPEAVEPIAKTLGIETWSGGLKPADKIRRIEEWKAAGKYVMMVGDGLNDAPALAAAHVSMSPISATDLTKAHADAVFLGERIQPVADVLNMAARARSLMIQNLWLAVVYNAIAVPLAIGGYVTPLIAAAAMSGSSILVTLNSLRAQRYAQLSTIRYKALEVLPNASCCG